MNILAKAAPSAFIPPSSSTDHALVRFDGTTGNKFQDSSVLVDDSNNMTGLVALTMTGPLTINSIEIIGTDGEVNKAAVEDSTNWDDAYSKRVDTWEDGLTYSSQTASIDYNTTNLQITANQINTIQDIASSSSPTFTDITLSGASISTTSGILELKGTGGTNNENLLIDFESTANEVIFSTTSGGDVFRFQGNIWAGTLDKGFIFGTTGGNDARLLFSSVGNNNLQLGLGVANAERSGYFSIMEKFGLGLATRSPASTSANPVLRIYSADGTQANDFIEAYFNQTDGIIDLGQGDLNIYPSASGDVTLFEGTDVADDANGKSLYIYRKAPEGDKSLRMYIDLYQYSHLISSGTFIINPSWSNNLLLYGGQNNAVIDIYPYTLNSGIVEFFSETASGESGIIRQYGYITADTDAKYVQWKVDDTDDYFHLTREDANILGLRIEMPLLTDGNVGINTTAPDTRLEVNMGTSDKVRLSYNAGAGSATDYTEFGVDSNGGLTITTVDASSETNGNITLSPDGLVDITTDLIFTGSGTGLPHGCLKGFDETVTCTNEDQWYQVTFDTEGLSNLTTLDTTNNEITISKTGRYLITIVACFHTGVAHDFELMVKKNDGATDLEPHVYQSTAVAGQVENVSGTCLVSLTANDRIELWVMCSDAAGQDAVFDHVSLTCVMIGG